MIGLEERLIDLGLGSAALALMVAFLLGLRHATDPDHLAAVTTLVLGEERERPRRAGILGLAWGAGHAATLVALGLPVVFLGQFLPDAVHQGAELVIGLVIVVLALRLLDRWWHGHFHTRVHGHRPPRHAHPQPADESHRHARSDGRTPLSAFGIGLVHGVGGSAGATILVVTAAGEPARAALALAIFALGTAASMALLSWGFGLALARGPVPRHLARLVPVFAVATLLFGIWYALDAVELVSHLR